MSAHQQIPCCTSELFHKQSLHNILRDALYTLIDAVNGQVCNEEVGLSGQIDA